MRLLKKVDDFNNEACTHISEALVDTIGEVPDVEQGEDIFLALLDEEDPAEQTRFRMPRLQAENKKLTLPSNLGLEACQDAGLPDLIEKEFKLRQGQANDALQGVRSALGEKSFLYRSDLRLADSKVKKTRSWTRLMKINQKLNFHRWVYNKARKALLALGADERLQSIYQPLTSEQLRVSTAIMQPNAAGQRNINLAWFWNVNLGPRDQSDNLLTECTFLPIHIFASCLTSIKSTAFITSEQMPGIDDGQRKKLSSVMKWFGPGGTSSIRQQYGNSMPAGLRQ